MLHILRAYHLSEKMGVGVLAKFFRRVSLSLAGVSNGNPQKKGAGVWQHFFRAFRLRVSVSISAPYSLPPCFRPSRRPCSRRPCSQLLDPAPGFVALLILADMTAEGLKRARAEIGRGCAMPHDVIHFQAFRPIGGKMPTERDTRETNPISPPLQVCAPVRTSYLALGGDFS